MDRLVDCHVIIEIEIVDCSYPKKKKEEEEEEEEEERKKKINAVKQSVK